MNRMRYDLGCISFDSYIKPQLRNLLQILGLVVYLLIPTSNHNHRCTRFRSTGVVYLLIPTSNHNFQVFSMLQGVLYIF